MAKLLRRGAMAAVGAAGAYLLDPDRGRARRARLKDQWSARARRRQREAESQIRYTEGQLEGAAARASGAGEPKPEDDVDVVNAIKQAFSRLDVATDEVTVEVVAGVATLRGQVDDAREIEIVEDATVAAPGVQEVLSWLHLPGAPAPNKAASLPTS